ncbi:MAG: SprB repeat-containing protein, partial [Proteobacteria bacterium]|nr:SprB repeat-containing protein [Pseudomonadota bacterium]
SNNASKKIDELQILTVGNFQYVALDALTWTKLVSYTVGTAVSPNSAYGTLSCVLTSVSPGGSTTCTATPNAGYELDNISGCGGTTSYSSSFATGAINASCTVTATFVVALGASTSKTDVSCNGGVNGTATVLASNGISPYTYSWSPAGGTAATASGLAAGTYTVTVTDNRNVQVQKSATINQPTALVLGPASIPDGLVNWPYAQGFIASGGTPGYTYTVTSGAVPGLSITGSTLSGTPSIANNYNVGVTVTDANVCQNAKTYPMQVRATMGLLSVSDGTGFAAYGQPVDYTVSLSNTTAFTVSGIAVTATLPAALGTPSWQCLSNGSNGVVCNGATNSGALADTGVTIPAGQTAKWNIHATVAAAPVAGSADVNVSASYATPATDSNVLVIFRDGFGGSGGN